MLKTEHLRSGINKQKKENPGGLPCRDFCIKYFAPNAKTISPLKKSIALSGNCISTFFIFEFVIRIPALLQKSGNCKLPGFSTAPL
jgi:hypothetical protein